jgi:hypothetical protein
VKRLLIILAAGLLTGCAVNQTPQARRDGLGPHEYEPASASGLAFDAPVAASYDLPGLDRAAREPGVYIGYQDVTTEIFSIGTIDNQTQDPCLDSYDRWSYTEKTGTRTR